MWWQRESEPVREMNEFERVVRADVLDLIREQGRLSRRERKAMLRGAWLGHKATMDLLERGVR